MLRDALKKMGRADLIGSGEHQLIPAYQSAPMNQGKTTGRLRTQHSRSEWKPNKSKGKHKPRRR
jgi:hypothetical protein